LFLSLFIKEPNLCVNKPNYLIEKLFKNAQIIMRIIMHKKNINTIVRNCQLVKSFVFQRFFSDFSSEFFF